MTEHPTTTAGLDPDVEDLLVRELRVKPEALAADATLEEAGLDSLSLVELSVLLSELLGSKVSEDEIHDARTVGGLAVLVENKRRGR
ncbi:phosphopantetheine-binding protein [Kitasatospora aureofaciens]|uniref:phosphopantetheine-binding protein n=1 Tax=Kitasatospora aureofaciens TaxID=1894 RepID=UPI001E3739B5|nr:phosphopantetheine-binding protein [Kitasatospora aureofaciens]